MENKFIQKSIPFDFNNIIFTTDPKIPIGSLYIPIEKPKNITEEQFNKDIEKIKFKLSINSKEDK